MNKHYPILFFVVILLFVFTKTEAQIQLEVWEIQGTERESSYEDERILTKNNVVTAVGNGYFFIQTPSDRADANDLTSNGLYISNNNTPVEVGDLVDITGDVRENSRTTYISSSGIIINIISNNSPLPDPVILDDNFPIGVVSDVLELEQVEGMRVQVNNAWITAPSNDNGHVYISARNNRSFREAGIEYPGISSQVVWDYNPEVMYFATNALGLPSNKFLSAGMRMDAVGIVDHSTDRYLFLPTSYQTTGAPIERAARPATATEATIGNLNGLFFLDSDSQYEIRLEKMVNYILNKMHSPDIIAFQEIGGLNELEDIAAAMHEENDSAIYEAYVGYGSGSIHTGYLVKNTVTVASVNQLGKNESLSIGGRTHDRAPLLLEATLNTNPPTPIQVLNVHLRSLNGITGSDANFVRTKRHEAAISVANMVRNLQLVNKDVIILGDFNAFEFTDGYVDVVNQITGQASLGAVFQVEPILETPLTNHILSIPESDRYSYIYQGNAQVLDHCVSTDLQGKTFNEMQFIRGNADNPDVYLDQEVPYRVSDHDGFVIYLGLEDTLSLNEEVEPISEKPIAYPNPFKRDDFIHFNLEKKANIDYQIISIDGKILAEGTFTAIDQSSEQLLLPQQIVSGIYILKLISKDFEVTDKLFINK